MERVWGLDIKYLYLAVKQVSDIWSDEGRLEATDCLGRNNGKS